jgi:hypothetical protein
MSYSELCGIARSLLGPAPSFGRSNYYTAVVVLKGLSLGLNSLATGKTSLYSIVAHSIPRDARLHWAVYGSIFWHEIQVRHICKINLTTHQ